MTITSAFHVNSIILVAMPRAGESGVANRISDTLNDLSRDHGVKFMECRPTDHESFSVVMEELEEQVRAGLRPVLQIDCHGSREVGLEAGESGEVISWQELLVRLQGINKLTDNNLVVILSACHGLEAGKYVSIDEHVPFYALYAPEGLIREGDIEDSLNRFYNVLVESQDFNAMHNALKSHFAFIHCEQLFALAFSRYIKEQCRGRVKARRVENILTRLIVERRVLNSRHNRRKFRRDIKARIQPSEADVHLLAKRFLGSRGFCGNLGYIMSLIHGGG